MKYFDKPVAFRILAMLIVAGLSSGFCLEKVPVLGMRSAFAESTVDAIQRIRQGAYTPMPPPMSTYATGPAGQGMTIENGTDYRLHIYFSGPVSRTVIVPDGESEGVDLVVGRYQVAAEVPGSSIMPFYGDQMYEPSTHYWLKFYVQQQWQWR